MGTTSSISVAMGTAISGLSANQIALATTSNNIANTNTVGYTQKSVHLENVLLDGQGAGVNIAAITRSVNEFMLRDVRVQTSLLAEFTVRSQYFGATQDMFGKPESAASIASRLTSFGNRLQALAVEPGSNNQQISAVNDALIATRQFNEMAQNIQVLRDQADDSIGTAVTTVNTLLDNIAELNGQVTRNLALNLPAGDLQDQRDQAVVKLAGYMDVSYFMRETGSIVIFSGSGRTLVDQRAATFTYTPTSVMNATSTYPGTIDGIRLDGTDVTTEFRSGQIKGLIDLRDTELPNLNTQLDRLATVLRDQFNAVHNDGVALPPPNTLTGTRLFNAPATDTVNLTGIARIAVLNADGTLAGTPINLNFADLATVVGGPPTVNQIRDAINGAYALSVPPIPGLAGATASVNASGALVINANIAGQGIGINETTSAETTTGFGFSHFFGLNDFFVGSTIGGLARNISVRPDIVADAQRMARGELSASALLSGDTGVTIGDASVVTRLANRFSDELTFSTAGGLPTVNTTLSGYGANILSQNATLAADADDMKQFRGSVLSEVQNKLDSASGVNMDEEMANLILYQNAYAASARVITTLSEVLRMLTEMV